MKYDEDITLCSIRSKKCVFNQLEYLRYVYIVHCTILIQCIMYTVHCTLYGVYRTVYGVQCTMYNAH